MKHRIPTLVSAALLLLFAVTLSAGEMRTWTNLEGRTIQAELLDTDGEMITLKIEGKGDAPYKLPLSSLSVADGEYAREWKAEQDAITDTPAPSTQPLMTTPGPLIFASDLAETDAEWRAAKGDWKAADGALSGTELAADDHGAVMKRALPLNNVIIEYEVMLGESKGTSFSMDDTKDHVCRVSISTTGFSAQKDDNDHEGPDVAKRFNRVSAELEPDQWHRLRIEILGEELLAQIGDDDDHISLGSDPLIATEKAKWGFTVAGDTVKFRNLKVWEALPNEEWEKTGKRLKRRLEIED